MLSFSPSLQEYLLALLDVMTRSTDQLITIFNKLSAPVSPFPLPLNYSTLFHFPCAGHPFIHFCAQFLKASKESIQHPKLCKARSEDLFHYATHIMSTSLHVFSSTATEICDESTGPVANAGPTGSRSHSHPPLPAPHLQEVLQRERVCRAAPQTGEGDGSH